MQDDGDFRSSAEEASDSDDVDPAPPAASPLRRGCAAALATGLGVAAVVFALRGHVEPRVIAMCGGGAVFGLLYALRGGRLPAWAYRHSGGKLTADDDPGNLPARVYLPILLVALLLAAAVLAWFVWG